MLKLNNKEFTRKEDDDEESTCYVNKSFEYDGTIVLDIEIFYNEDIFEDFMEDERISPTIFLNSLETKVKKYDELKGKKFICKSVEESQDMEHSLRLIEEEPFENYTIEIIDANEEEIHIKGSGSVVIDGYADPPVIATFEFDETFEVDLECLEE